MRIIGIDPGLQRTGWGVVEASGHSLRHVAHGVLATDPRDGTADRLARIFDGLSEVLRLWLPQTAAVEETFVNSNPASALKLGQARGVALLAPARQGLSVAEYAPTVVKKAVVGTGHADKTQVQAMIKILLQGIQAPADAADALAVAICHAHHAQSRVGVLAGAGR